MGVQSEKIRSWAKGRGHGFVGTYVMLNLSTSLLAAALTLAAVQGHQAAPSSARRETSGSVRSCIGAPADPAQAPWALTWDDTLDDTLDDVGKRCRVTLEAIDSVVTGRFDGLVLGTRRRATFTGELIQGGALLLLQQREPGYVCSYQLTSKGAGWLGSWRDSRGASGTARLARVSFDLDLDV